jgi:hypothetical protein
MIRHLIVSLVTAFLCFSCATDPGPKPTFQDGTRVGIMNSLESYLTHRHITINRINSFTRQIKVNWDMPTYVDTQLADSLKMDNFNWPADMNNIPQAELDKLRPRIQACAAQAVKNALQSAHMVSSEGRYETNFSKRTFERQNTEMRK